MSTYEIVGLIGMMITVSGILMSIHDSKVTTHKISTLVLKLEDDLDSLKLKYELLRLQPIIKEYCDLTHQYLDYTIEASLHFKSDFEDESDWVKTHELEARVDSLKRSAAKTKAKK